MISLKMTGTSSTLDSLDYQLYRSTSQFALSMHRAIDRYINKQCANLDKGALITAAQVHISRLISIESIIRGKMYEYSL